MVPEELLSSGSGYAMIRLRKGAACSSVNGRYPVVFRKPVEPVFRKEAGKLGGNT
ncbi:hypothetical protein P9847_09525 [Paenibacillus chibensis]|uniref:Uncharacterized protein n=1 Tax=Paenibacillus chibensis TaxID=59846 RepID=A0ABU6PT45_9BACL|nr:hypothetical protein [Paenibacillus chibensis]MEC0371955.1 hypothetical protein [Paenibacillus chibensis]MED5017539.1 hypothetical protein [Paenibacillus chibensis]